MKFSTLVKIFGGTALTVAATISASAQGYNYGMLIGAESIESLNSQEKAAAAWFISEYPEGTLITPSTTSKIDATTLDVIWVNIDRLEIGSGIDNLPSAFKSATGQLTSFLNNGGNLYLSKHATQLVAGVGRVSNSFQTNIFSDGDGGAGTDVWNVNAHLGSWQFNPDNLEQDPSQVYDRRIHAIYSGLTEFAAWSEWNNYPHTAFPLEGTGTGAEMHREDHNCMWDLNGYAYTADGKNTVEKFEKENDCVVLGTWGHVQDYAVAAIIEFAPKSSSQGRIIANGLAAYEWAPRNGGNAYHDNIERLTSNILSYLKPVTTGVDTIDSSVQDGETIYYTIQGVRVENPRNGLFIKVQNGKASKELIK